MSICTAARWLRTNAHPLTWNGAAFCFLALVAYETVWRPEPGAAFAMVLVSAAGMCGIFGNAHRFEVFKVYGLEARTREVVKEAEAATAILRDLAADLAAVMVHSVSNAGRFGGKSSYREMDNQKSAILNTLARLGISGVQLANVAAADRPNVLVDYVVVITRKLSKVPNAPSALLKATREYWEASGIPPTAEELRSIATGCEAVPAEIFSLIEDLAHYEKHSVHRRPDVWAARGSWLG